MAVRQKNQTKQLFLWFVVVLMSAGCTWALGTSPAQEVNLVASPVIATLPTPVIITSEPLQIPTPTLAVPAPQTDANGYPVPSSVPSTNTPMPDGATCFVNRIAGFTLQIPSGWFMNEPWDTEFINVFTNYAPKIAGSGGGFLPGEQKIDIMVFPLELEEGISFEQWVEEERMKERLSHPLPGELSEAVPYTLGSYSGVAYSIHSGTGIVLTDAGQEKVISISLYSEDTSAQSEALEILSTLDTSGNETCD